MIADRVLKYHFLRLYTRFYSAYVLKNKFFYTDPPIFSPPSKYLNAFNNFFIYAIRIPRVFYLYAPLIYHTE